MSDQTKIQWCDSTWNPWRGCSKVSPGCQNCYAEKLVVNRLGGEWGPDGVRVRSKDFNVPLRWNKRPWVCNQCGAYCAMLSHECGIANGDEVPLTVVCDRCKATTSCHRRRMFSLSLGDWLEGEPKSWGLTFKGRIDRDKPIGGVPVEWLADMLDVVRRCDQLHWILCTKRTEQFYDRMEHALVSTSGELQKWIQGWMDGQRIPPQHHHPRQRREPRAGR